MYQVIQWDPPGTHICATWKWWELSYGAELWPMREGVSGSILSFPASGLAGDPIASYCLSEDILQSEQPVYKEARWPSLSCSLSFPASSFPRVALLSTVFPHKLCFLRPLELFCSEKDNHLVGLQDKYDECKSYLQDLGVQVVHRIWGFKPL